MELPLYNFRLVFNSNTWTNYAPLRYISLQNLIDLDFNLSRSKVLMLLDSLHMAFYQCLIVTYSVTRLLYEV